MKIYDYVTQDAIEISDTQYDFMQFVVKHNGNIDLALKDYPVSQEQLNLWKEDKIFWPCLEAHLVTLARARGLNSDYIKDYLLSTLTGQKEPTEVQMKAINASVRALGMGLAARRGFSGSVVVSPSNTQIVFEDGLERK